MEKSAIEAIQKSASLPEAIKLLEKANTKTPLTIVPESYELFDLERYMPNRSSYRFSYGTDSIEDYIEYCKKFDQDGSTCFIKSEFMSAKTVFDLGRLEAPGHQLHTAGLLLKKTAAYEALRSICSSNLNQMKAADFLEDWADLISIKNTSGDAMTVNAAVSSLQNLTIDQAKSVNSKVSDFGESMDTMEKVEARNRDQLPAFINFDCVPYLSFESRKFTMKLSILTSGEKPLISLRITQLEQIIESITQEFKGILTDAFKDCKMDTYLGVNANAGDMPF